MREHERRDGGGGSEEGRDSYDEFEDRMKRIGRGTLLVWKKLSVSERVGHLIGFATLLAMVIYTGFTVRIYKSANDSAQEARLAREQSAKQFDSDQRPYLWISAQSTYSIPNMPIVSQIYIANYGKTPAIRERELGTVFWGPDALMKADHWFAGIRPEYWKGVPEHIIPPGIPPDPKKTNSAIVQSVNPVPKTSYDWLNQHDASVISVMRIEYYDESGNRYWSDICSARFTGSERLGQDCPRHNEIH